jgi:hypothetical protein
MLLTCVGNQNMIHLWDKDTSEITSREVDANLDGAGGHLADEAEGDDDARLWCHPRLRRAKGNTTSGQYFEPQPTDDFSGFGKASIPLGVGLIPFSEPIGPGEKARGDAKQTKLVEHFRYASAPGVLGRCIGFGVSSVRRSSYLVLVAEFESKLQEE